MLRLMGSLRRPRANLEPLATCASKSVRRTAKSFLGAIATSIGNANKMHEPKFRACLPACLLLRPLQIERK